MADIDFYPRSSVNAAVTETSVSFDLQLPLGQEAGTGAHMVAKDQLVPPGVVFPAPGRIRFNFMAADAREVKVEFFHEMYAMEKQESGLWTLELETDRTGYNWIAFYVDGAEVTGAEQLSEAGEFAKGSMGPKVRAGINFVRATGKVAIITALDKVMEALKGEVGTMIVP